MTTYVPRLPFSLDPLIAEAKRRLRRRRLLVAAVLVLAGAGTAAAVIAARSPGGPGSAGPPSGGSGVLWAGRVGAVRMDSAGTIGPLHMNRSSRAQVVAFAGKPNVERHASVGEGYAENDVLGYGCKGGAGAEKYWSGYVIECRTAFYLVDGKLSLFFDQWQGPLIARGRRYVEVSGVRIGTPTERAERLLHQRAFSGCTDAISIQTKHTGLTISLAGGKLHIVGTKHYLAGGHVDGFYLHGLRDPSVTDCD